MKEKHTVSFIIPAFNAETTISDCINNILKIKNVTYEIIVVNDGSTDNTAKCVEKFQEEKVKLYNVKNGGVSSARNYGMQKAIGEYIVFVDADDKILAENFEKIISLLDQTAEVIMFSYIQRYGQKENFFSVPDINGERNNTNRCNQLIECMLDIPVYHKKENHYMAARVWQYLFKKEYLVTLKCQFDTRLPFAEDLCFCIDVLWGKPKLQLIPVYAYEYQVNMGSASRKYRVNYWNELQLVYNHLEKRLGREIPNLFLGYGKKAVEHYCIYEKNTKKRNENVKKVVSNNRIKEAVKQTEKKSKTWFEHIEDKFWINEKYFGVEILYLIKNFPMKCYQKIKRGMLNE